MSQEHKKAQALEEKRKAELRDEYRLLFLGNKMGRIILADMLHKLKFFNLNMTAEDLPLRNYAMDLIADLSDDQGSTQSLAFIDKLMGGLDDVRAIIDRRKGLRR